MKIVWKLLVVLGVLAAAGAAVLLWMRERKHGCCGCDEEDVCTWDDVCAECNGCDDIPSEPEE